MTGATRLPGDVLFGLGLTVLAWAGLVLTVLRGRANVERHVRGPKPSEEDRDE